MLRHAFRSILYVLFAVNAFACDSVEDGSAPTRMDDPAVQRAQGLDHVPESMIELLFGHDGFQDRAYRAAFAPNRVATGCLMPEIHVPQGSAVIPQTELHLQGFPNWLGDAEAAQWNWIVTQPAGSASVLQPSASVRNPSFEANVAGEYLFELVMKPDQGPQPCFNPIFAVLVSPQNAIHVELLWDTPADPDQSNVGAGAGTDLDLHFAHPLAFGPDLDGDGEPDGWFDVPFDAFWFNPGPSWEDVNPAVDDDPSLDRDDTDGAGPENLNLNEPVNGHSYRVGVHYWDDHPYGESYATVRVYLYGLLVFEESAWLDHLDMWDVARIHWDDDSPSVEAVTNDDGTAKITPNYRNPIFN